MSLFPAYRGIKIKPYMENLRYYIFSFFFLLFSPILGFYIYQNLEKLKNADVPSIVIVSLMVTVFSLISLYLTWFSQERFFFFQKLERLAKLAFFLKENGYSYTKKIKTDSGTRDKVVFPAVYMKQNRYDLEIAFKMAGNKFQDKFKKIGSDLETTFFMDFMEVQDDIKFKTYKMAYSAFQNRIKISDVEYSSKGIQLMKNLYWNPIDDPHLLVCGGTGGGKNSSVNALKEKGNNALAKLYGVRANAFKEGRSERNVLEEKKKSRKKQANKYADQKKASRESIQRLKEERLKKGQKPFKENKEGSVKQKMQTPKTVNPKAMGRRKTVVKNPKNEGKTSKAFRSKQTKKLKAKKRKKVEI